MKVQSVSQLPAPDDDFRFDSVVEDVDTITRSMADGLLLISIGK